MTDGTPTAATCYISLLLAINLFQNVFYLFAGISILEEDERDELELELVILLELASGPNFDLYSGLWSHITKASSAFILRARSCKCG